MQDYAHVTNKYRHDYHMRDQTLAIVTEVKGLWIITFSDLKPKKQCTAAANKVNEMFGMPNGNATYKTNYNALKLCSVFFRTHIKHTSNIRHHI